MLFFVGMAEFLAIGALLLHVTRRTFGPRAEAGAGLLFACGPFYLYYRGLLPDGPYQTTFVLVALALALLVEIAARNEQGRPIGVPFVVLGAALGLAWWTHPVSLASIVAAALVLATGSWWRRLPWWAWAGFAAVFFLASAPWWGYNISTGFSTLRGSDAERATAEQASHQLALLLGHAPPLFVGFGRLPWTGPPPAWVWSVAAVLWLGVVAAFFLRWLRDPAISAATKRAFGLFSLLQPALGLAIALSATRGTLGDPRFIYPLFFFVLPTGGALLGRLNRRAAVCLGLAIVALHAAGYRSATADVDWKALSRRVEASGIRALYADYFIASVVTLETERGVVGTPFPVGQIVRRTGDRAFVDAAPDPGFLLRGSEADRLARFVRSRGGRLVRWPVTPELVLLTQLPRNAVDQIRRCYCVPSGLGSEAVVWGAASGPDHIPPGTRAVYRVTVTNRSDFAWTHAMYLSYHWLGDDGRMVLFDGLRSAPQRPLAPGETLRVEVTTQAPRTPGRYVLEFDAVEENVAWFSQLGSRGPSKDILVR